MIRLKAAVSRHWFVCVAAAVVAVRTINVLFVNTYFAPDEFWQGPEVRI